MTSNGSSIELTDLISEKDDKGDTGETGEIGATGSQGIQGEKGATGATGPAGIDGIDGAQGIQDETGPQGIKGETGAQGIQGETGPAGIDGADGAQGMQGEVGATGPQGIQGETGAIGPQGIQGETGPAGMDITSQNLNFSDGNVGIGTTTPTSSLHITGSIAAPIRRTAVSTTMGDNDYTLVMTDNNLTITLPAASNSAGRIYILKNISTGNNITSGKYICNKGYLQNGLKRNKAIWLQSDGVDRQQINIQ